MRGFVQCAAAATVGNADHQRRQLSHWISCLSKGWSSPERESESATLAEPVPQPRNTSHLFTKADFGPQPKHEEAQQHKSEHVCIVSTAQRKQVLPRPRPEPVVGILVCAEASGSCASRHHRSSFFAWIREDHLEDVWAVLALHTSVCGTTSGTHANNSRSRKCRERTSLKVWEREDCCQSAGAKLRDCRATGWWLGARSEACRSGRDPPPPAGARDAGGDLGEECRMFRLRVCFCHCASIFTFVVSAGRGSVVFPRGESRMSLA
mmetsp:Transcript_57223/g.152604  ORF Transcript_57223/g.152604 Transcript_57223/m.152604 type:complete len:265 (+) Transcript_57223:3465-4259(+)